LNNPYQDQEIGYACYLYNKVVGEYTGYTNNHNNCYKMLVCKFNITKKGRDGHFAFTEILKTEIMGRKVALQNLATVLPVLHFQLWHPKSQRKMFCSNLNPFHRIFLARGSLVGALESKIVPSLFVMQ